MQPITVQCDLCLPSTHTTAGDFGSPKLLKSSSGQDHCRSWLLRAIDSERLSLARHLAKVRLAKSPYRLEVAFHSSKERVPSRASGVDAGPRDMHVKKGIQGASCDCEDAIGIPLGSRRENNGQQDARPGRDRHW